MLSSFTGKCDGSMYPQNKQKISKVARFGRQRKQKYLELYKETSKKVSGYIFMEI